MYLKLRERKERMTIPSYSCWLKNIRQNMQIKFEAGDCLTWHDIYSHVTPQFRLWAISVAYIVPYIKYVFQVLLRLR